MPKASNASGDSNAKKEDASKKSTLGLNNHLKQVLMTNACLSANDIDRLFKEAKEN